MTSSSGSPRSSSSFSASSSRWSSRGGTRAFRAGTSASSRSSPSCSSSPCSGRSRSSARRTRARVERSTPSPAPPTPASRATPAVVEAAAAGPGGRRGDLRRQLRQLPHARGGGHEREHRAEPERLELRPGCGRGAGHAGWRRHAGLRRPALRGGDPERGRLRRRQRGRLAPSPRVQRERAGLCCPHGRGARGHASGDAGAHDLGDDHPRRVPRAVGAGAREARRWGCSSRKSSRRRKPGSPSRPDPGRIDAERVEAERAGFEPATQLSPGTRFPVALLRPARTPLRGSLILASPVLQTPSAVQA